MQEEIINETHRIRREIAAQFHDDVHSFFEYLRQREAQRPGHVVTLDHIPSEPSGTTSASSTSREDTGRLMSG